MMTLEQEHQIELYLRSRKLSQPLLLEVKDHFLLQISNLMEDKEISFQEAFLATRMSWKDELEMVNADILSFKKVPRIEKSLLQKRFSGIMMRSFICSLILGLLYILSETVFFYFEIFSLLIFAAVLLFGVISGKLSFGEYQRMSFHPLLLRNIILGILLFPFGCYFSGSFIFWEPAFNQVVIFYSMTIQIQLLYFITKKINVLV